MSFLAFLIACGGVIVGSVKLGFDIQTLSRRTRVIFWLVAFAYVLSIGIAVRPEIARWFGRETVIGSVLNAPADVAEVNRVVRESQTYEDLVLDEKPERLDDRQLLTYWLPAQDGGEEIDSVRKSLDRFRRNGWRYGSDSKVLQLDPIQSLVFHGDTAQVITQEYWFVPTVDSTGRRVRSLPDLVGPYCVKYGLTRWRGHWLIRWSSTPRARR